MKLVENKLRVVHVPQVPMEGYSVEVFNEREAFLIEQAFAGQHLFLYSKNVIPDYSNVIFVEMFKNGKWVDYYNEDEMMDWDEFVETYEDYVNSGSVQLLNS